MAQKKIFTTKSDKSDVKSSNRTADGSPKSFGALLTSRKNSFRIVNLLIAVIGVLILISVFSRLDIDLWREMLLFIVYGILTEALLVSVPYGQLSLRFVVVLSSFMIFGGPGAVFICWLFCLLGRGIFNKGDSWIITILYSLYSAVGVYFGAALYQLIGGTISETLTWANGWRLLAFLLGYFLIVNILGSFILYQDRTRKFYDKKWLNPLKLDLISCTLTIPLGILTFYIYTSVGVKVTILLFIPILAVQYLASMTVRLENANRELSVVYKIAKRLSDRVDLEKILPIILNDFKELVPYQCAVIYLWSEDKIAYIPVTVEIPAREEQVEVPVIYSNKDMLWNFIDNGEAEIIANTMEDPRFEEPVGISKICSSLLMVPWSVRGQKYGLIMLGQKKPFCYQNSHLRVMDLLTSELSIVVANHVLSEKLERVDNYDISGALNMNSFILQAGRQLRNGLHNNRPGIMLYVVIKFFDDFKLRNNYVVAEELMKELVKYLNDFIKAPFLVGRYGSGELVVYIDNIRGDKALELAYNLKSEVAMEKIRLRSANLNLHITIEIGKGLFPKDGEDVLVLIQSAQEDIINKKKNIYLNLNNK